MDAKQFAAYALVAATFTPVCWAQVTSTSQVSASPELKRVGIASVRNRSASTIIPALVSAQTPSSRVGAAPGFHLVNVMPTIGQAASSTPTDNGIQYHGGPIIDDANGINVYFIWYGDWSKNTAAQTIVTDFINHLGGSPYTAVNTTYYDTEPGPTGTNVVKDWVTTGIHYMGSTTDLYSSGKSLTDQNIGDILGNSIGGGALPADPNGVYFVLTSADVVETSGFCTQYCAFHGYATDPSGNKFLGAFVGNPDQCPNACAQESVLPTPNSNVGADGMVNLIAHETEEAVTDPYGTAWWNSVTGDENEDMCLFTFGRTYNLPNGSYANMKLGDRQYLIQRNWVNKQGGFCALSWGE